ncbi:MAG: hypothetical protein NTX50_25140 [Candidatus Sumerlaeota bacterium]|nr:hypothetical protein [Candidatus Sumerlaeota bacterium]
MLRETVNNALAHRDYSINKQVIISIKPGAHIAIRNPGAFRKHLLLEDIKSPIPLRRIIPEAKPRNPKLADVLKVYQKWEGRGIGMATLVNLCVQNQIDLPYFRFYSEEVCLYLCCGKLLDERMERLFQSFDGYIEAKLRGRQLTEQQKLVLSYIIKSEWANEQERYTILLTPDNNHFGELAALGQAGLIIQHPLSASPYIVYIADRTLIASDYIVQLREMFGASFDSLDNFFKEILNVVYRFNHFSKIRLASPKRTSFALWMNQGKSAQDIQEFDRHYRKVRYSFNKLEKWGFVINQKNGKVSTGYQLNKEYMKNHLGENPL